MWIECEDGIWFSLLRNIMEFLDSAIFYRVKVGHPMNLGGEQISKDRAILFNSISCLVHRPLL